MKSLGIDIVDIDTVVRARFSKRLAEYFLTKNELSMLKKRADPAVYIASRFAAKEAVIKALAGNIKPHDFEIKNSKPPMVKFLLKKHRGLKVLLSISHSEKSAVGLACLL